CREPGPLSVMVPRRRFDLPPVPYGANGRGVPLGAGGSGVSAFRRDSRSGHRNETVRVPFAATLDLGVIARGTGAAFPRCLALRFGAGRISTVAAVASRGGSAARAIAGASTPSAASPLALR